MWPQHGFPLKLPERVAIQKAGKAAEPTLRVVLLDTDIIDNEDEDNI